jgi:hypothetical protein
MRRSSSRRNIYGERKVWMTNRLSLVTSVFMLVACSPAGCGNITLSPATMSLKGPAGQATTQNFRVLNLTDSVYEFSVDISDVLVEDGKRVFIPADQSPLSLASLVITSLPSFELKPRRTENRAGNVRPSNSHNHSCCCRVLSWYANAVRFPSEDPA